MTQLEFEMSKLSTQIHRRKYELIQETAPLVAQLNRILCRVATEDGFFPGELYISQPSKDFGTPQINLDWFAPNDTSRS
jgi:hypothetical protein